MSNIFYFFGLIILLLNFLVLTKFSRLFELSKWVIKFKEITGKDPIKKDYRKEDDLEILTYWSVTVLVTSLWVFFGLLSKNWYIFSSLILINIIINIIVKMVGKFSKLSFVLLLLKNVIIFLVITFLVVNHFHLHLDTWNLLKSIIY